VVHWLNNSRARIMSVPADLRAAPTCSEIDLPYRDPRAKWIGAAASSLLLLETGPLGIDVVRLNLPEGTRQSLGRIHAAHASFVHGIDRSLHIMAEGVRRRMISRVDSNSLVPIMQTCADLSAPQVVRERVCALVIAERGRPHWRLHIDGRCVLDEPCAPSARAQRASRIKRCGSGHLVPGDPSTAVGIIYVPSLFGPDRVWGQAPFFQHVLFSITRQLHGEGFAYFVMKSLRGARRERELLIESVALRLEDALEQLRSAGCKRIGIIGGSIAGYALTRCSELVNRAAALMLLSPVHQLSPPIARRFGYDTADSLQDVAAAIASRASLLSTPTVIMHGIRDELSPSIHSSVFISSMPVHVAKCYLPIMDEGHIFQHFHNWRRLTTLFTDFARLQLRPDGNLQSRR
jgi:hypothetical protein